MVKLIDPVVAALRLKIVLAAPCSIDAASVALECFSPTVNVSRFVPDNPFPTLHSTAESDRHPLPSHAVTPAHPAGVISLALIPLPIIVMLADPVAARFVASTMLAAKESTETNWVALPVSRPRVSASLCEFATP